MNCEEFYQLIEAGKENRRLEFKGSGAWSDSNFREKIIRSVLAMSNIKDGGDIVIGVTQTQEKINLDGMKDGDFASFSEETVKDKVSNYTDPNVDFDLEKVTCDKKKFIVIRVREFEEVPIICKKSGSELKEGAIYVRTKHKRPQSVPIPDSNHMREMVNHAIEKKFLKKKKQLSRWGYEPAVSDEEKFKDQLKDLEI